jgi:hypothetical protein
VGVKGNIYASNGLSVTNVSASSFLAAGGFTVATGGPTVGVKGNIYASNGLSVTNVSASSFLAAGGFTVAAGGPTVGVAGNIYASNSLTTSNIFAATTILKGTTGKTSLDVTGNIYGSNSLTTSNIFANGFTSDVNQTQFNYSTLDLSRVTINGSSGTDGYVLMSFNNQLIWGDPGVSPWLPDTTGGIFYYNIGLNVDSNPNFSINSVGALKFYKEETNSIVILDNYDSIDYNAFNIFITSQSSLPAPTFLISDFHSEQYSSVGTILEGGYDGAVIPAGGGDITFTYVTLQGNVSAYNGITGLEASKWFPGAIGTFKIITVSYPYTLVIKFNTGQVLTGGDISQPFTPANVGLTFSSYNSMTELHRLENDSGIFHLSFINTPQNSDPYSVGFGFYDNSNNTFLLGRPPFIITPCPVPTHTNDTRLPSISIALDHSVFGFVGINTFEPIYQLDVTGNININDPHEDGFNLLYNGVIKAFNIEHPILENERLVHSCIEGPRIDLIYRGTIKLFDGTAHVNIDSDSATYPMTQGTFVALCTNPQYFLQNSDSFDRVIGKLDGNILKITCENKNSTDVISWMVIAERCDAALIPSSYTDSKGILIPEYTRCHR